MKRIDLGIGAGVTDKKDEPELMKRVMSTRLKLMAGNVLKDSRGMVDVVKIAGSSK